MADHIHGNRLRDSCPFEVSDGRSTEVVGNKTGIACLSAGRPPCLDEAFDPDSASVEDPRHDPSLELQPIRLGSLPKE